MNDTTMEILFQYQNILLKRISFDFIRSLYDQINWEQRMLGIKGPRGSGKTTLILQRLKKEFCLKNNALYVTADHPYFFTHSLLDLAHNFYNHGGRYLFIDEVHKYDLWSRELKLIYDGFPDLKVVFTASSALDIYHGESDLSRRVITYILPGLSFREFLELVQNTNYPVISFDQIVHDHIEITREISKKISLLPQFKEYLKTGYLPILCESRDGEEYLIRINQIINAIIDSDLSYTDGYTTGAAIKVKKLLGILAESAPFKPNIASIARKLDIGREYVYTYIKHLEEARLFNLLHKSGKGISLLQKPDKLFLENTNLSFALKVQPDAGTLRETFLMNQLVNAGMEVYYPDKGDFLINNMIIEVGGKWKKPDQFKGDYEQVIVAANNIDEGLRSRIPLWLFGFLY